MKIIDLKDRFARSLVAGFIASIILWGLNMFSYYVLQFSNRRYINYSALIIFGRKSENLSETIISSIAQIGFSTGLIVIFSYIILKENNKNYLWRGLFVGLGSWFAIMAVSYIIKINTILKTDINSAISFIITSSIWGIIAAWLLHIMDENYGT